MMGLRFDAGEAGRFSGPCEAALRGHSRHTREQVFRAARTSSSLLIVGEPGLGKAGLAQAIHEQSARRNAPLIAIDLSDLPDSSLDNELFGCAADSSPGDERCGRLVAAHGGTVFLDHVEELPATAQAKLLRLLEKGLINRWDTGEDRRVDVRVIAASDVPLEPRVAERSFRDDLYSRLSVLVIRLSPLRERPEDIVPYITHWLRDFCAAGSAIPLSLDVELLRWMENYAWPGNLHQLNRCLEQMVLAARSPTLTLVDLPEGLIESPFGGVSTARTGRETLSELERTIALRTLQQCGGNRTRAADILGISVRTLQRRLKEWDYHDEVGKT
jgi:DNA-binding NtrC family response regulator